jgi:hypothetical protein
MADKGKLSLEQRIKTVFFFTETRSVVVTQRWFMPIFKREGRLPSKQFINFITSLIIMVQCWEETSPAFIWRILTLSE